MTLWTTLKNLFGTLTLATPAELRAFLESRSAYYVQKSITEYSQARANMAFSTLLGEKQFREAYEAARWRAFPAGLSAVAEIMAGNLRERLMVDAADASKITQNHVRSILSAYPLPAFAAADYWDKALAALGADLARAELAQPRKAHAIAHNRATEIFDSLPFHTAIRQHDFEMFRQTLAFHLTEIAVELADAKLNSGVLAKV